MRHSSDGPAKPTAFPVPDAIHNHTGDHVQARPAPWGRQPATTTVHPPSVHPSSESAPPAQSMIIQSVIIVGSGSRDLLYRHGTVATPTPTGQFR